MVHLARDHYRKGILIKDKISLSSHMLTFDDKGKKPKQCLRNTLMVQGVLYWYGYQ